MAEVHPAEAPPRALSIAGSDSGGGAGIQADLKTFSALGVFGMTAVTAVTVQNTMGVSDWQELRPDIVTGQILAVVSDIGVDAAKTGMLATAEVIRAVASALEDAPVPTLVVDPVFVSKHGDPLLRAEAVDAIRERILPLATLITPNLHEASGLLGGPIEDRAAMEEAARALRDLGPGAVLVKGGHLEEGAAADVFYDGETLEWLEAERIDSPHTHGTGCTLSAAITAYVALGDELATAVRRGKAFVTEAIRCSLKIGSGIGPVNPLWGSGAPRRAPRG